MNYRPGIKNVIGTVTAIVAVMCCAFSARGQVNAEQVTNIGRNALYFEDYMVAVQYFNQAIKAKPYLAKPYFFRAIAKLNLEDYGGAEEDASKAIELNPFITDAYEVRGVARQNRGNNSGAVEDYRQALELVPRNRQLLFNMACAQTSGGNYDDADSTFSSLLSYYPGFENGYLGRARLRIAQTDTIAALRDIDTALDKDPDSFNGHVMRAELLMRRRIPRYETALEDMNAAVRLDPRQTGLYINRAYIRYQLDDWYGAMADYDHALTLDPLNKTALFNRGLLNTEVEANDKAHDDFSAVLKIDPTDHRAYYNRALIRARKHDYKGAISDAGHVIEAFPDFPAGYLLRSDLERNSGNLAAAARDYDKAMALTRKLKPGQAQETTDNEAEDPAEMTRREFATLLTVDDNSDLRQEYNNTAIRGRVQDRNVGITPEPIVELSYYNSPTELNPDTYYIKEIDELNTTRQLRFVVFVTIHAPVLKDAQAIERHFASIEYYNSYLATHPARAVDYIGRAMDFITLRNYDAAVEDLDRAIAVLPDYAPSYMLRAQANYLKGQGDEHSLKETDLVVILADIDRAMSISRNNPFLYYNKAVILLALNRADEALEALGKAIELKPDFGQAYYNRGYIYLQTGQRTAGIDDLSRAGELGVTQAYNLMKRISDH